MFHFLHIQTGSDKNRIRSRYDKHHIYGSHGLLFHIHPDLPVEKKVFHFSAMQSRHQNGSRKSTNLFVLSVGMISTAVKAI